MNNIKQYNEARTEIEACFNGLPHAPARLVNLLITKASPETGFVENITYSDLAILLNVDSSPGRKDSGTPQKQTIRSYLRTIESQCGVYFKVISDGQMLKIHFLTLPEIYAAHFDYIEPYTDLNMVLYTVTPLINTDQNASNDDEVNIEEYTDLYTPDAEQEINVHAENKQTKTNQNTQTDRVVESFSQSEKHLIADDFYPSDAIIHHALNKGLTKATDLSEIKKFILYNQAISSVRVDHNPLFLRWLERDAEHTEKLKKIANSQQKWSKNNERHGHRFDSAETANRGEHGAHTVVISGEYIERFGGRADIKEQHRMAVDAVDQSVWQTIPYQTRCPR